MATNLSSSTFFESKFLFFSLTAYLLGQRDLSSVSSLPHLQAPGAGGNVPIRDVKS
jgi:hypothetical protein